MYKYRLRIALRYYEALVDELEQAVNAGDGYPAEEYDAKSKKDDVRSTRKCAKKELKRLYTQILFFQHERLIHLIVTVLFALATVITIPFNLMLVEPALMLLSGLLLVLLVPYVVHYYHLENGVQTLYKLYDRLEVVATGMDRIYSWAQNL